jgi:hypothetical protein
MAETYMPLPQHLEHLVQDVVKEASGTGDASNTVFVITQALAKAYAAGHKDSWNLAMSQQWVTEDLKRRRDKVQAARAAKDS